MFVFFPILTYCRNINLHTANHHHIYTYRVGLISFTSVERVRMQKQETTACLSLAARRWCCCFFFPKASRQWNRTPTHSSGGFGLGRKQKLKGEERYTATLRLHSPLFAALQKRTHVRRSARRPVVQKHWHMCAFFTSLRRDVSDPPVLGGSWNEVEQANIMHHHLHTFMFSSCGGCRKPTLTVSFASQLMTMAGTRRDRTGPSNSSKQNSRAAECINKHWKIILNCLL